LLQTCTEARDAQRRGEEIEAHSAERAYERERDLAVVVDTRVSLDVSIAAAALRSVLTTY